MRPEERRVARIGALALGTSVIGTDGFVIAGVLPGMAVVTPAQSRRIVESTPSVGPEVLSLDTSAIYFGIAAGTALGRRVLAHFGVAQLGLAGAALEVAALLVVARAPDTVRPPADDAVPLAVLRGSS